MHQRADLLLTLYLIVIQVIIISNLNIFCASLETKNDNGARVEGEEKLEEAIELLKEHQTSGVDPVKVVKAGVESIDVPENDSSLGEAAKGEEEAKLKNGKPADNMSETFANNKQYKPLSSLNDPSVINKNVIASPSDPKQTDYLRSDEHNADINGVDLNGNHHDDDYDEHGELDPETVINDTVPRGSNNQKLNIPLNNESSMRDDEHDDDLNPYQQEYDDYMDNDDEHHLDHANRDDELRRVDNPELDPEEEEFMTIERPQDEDNDDTYDYNDDEDTMLVGDHHYDPEYELYDDDDYENSYGDEFEREEGMMNNERDPNGQSSVTFSQSMPPNGANRDANNMHLNHADMDYDDDDPRGQHYEDSWVDDSDPNEPTLNRLKHDEDVWQDPDGVVHHEKSRHKSSSTINNNADPNNFHEAHKEEHQESKSSVYNGGSMQRKRSFRENNSRHHKLNQHQRQQFYSDSDSESETDLDSDDSDYDPLNDYEPEEEMRHNSNPAVDMAKRALDSLNHRPPRAQFDEMDNGTIDRNQPGQHNRKRRRHHYHTSHHRQPEMGYPQYDEPSDYEDDLYDDGNNFYDPYNMDPYASHYNNDPHAHAAATAVAGNGASAMSSSSTFGPDGIERSHVVSDRSYLGPDGRWVRETFSNRDGDITSNVYPHDSQPYGGLHGDLPNHNRHRSRMEKLRAKQSKAMSKMAKKHRKLHERLMRKHEQNVNGAMARAQAVANGRSLF